MINSLLFGATYAFACVVQPGPFQAYLISRSLAYGTRKTLPIIFAPLLSDVPIALLMLTVVSVVPPQVLPVLQLAGGALLIYLAVGAFRLWRRFDGNDPQSPAKYPGVLKAALVNVLNPGPYLGWSLVLAPALIRSWSENRASSLLLLAGFYGTMILGSAALVFLFGSARKVGPGINRAALGLSAIALGCFAVHQLWSATVLLGGW